MPQRCRARLSGAVAVTFPPETDLECLRTLAGVDGIAPVDDAAFDVDPSPRSAPLAAAAFQLAKAGRLVPALIGFDNDGEAVPGVLTIAVATSCITRRASATMRCSS